MNIHNVHSILEFFVRAFECSRALWSSLYIRPDPRPETGPPKVTDGYLKYICSECLPAVDNHISIQLSVFILAALPIFSSVKIQARAPNSKLPKLLVLRHWTETYMQCSVRPSASSSSGSGSSASSSSGSGSSPSSSSSGSGASSSGSGSASGSAWPPCAHHHPAHEAHKKP